MPFPPLGTLYAAALMRKNGYSAGLFDTNLLDSPKKIKTVLTLQQPKYLVIYDDGFNYLTKMCLTNMRDACFEMIGYGKKNNCTVIICSSDATDHYEDYLNKGADYILLGEGEITLLELINSLEKKESIDALPGIAWRKEGQTAVNPKRPVLQNLDELPFPAWDLVSMQDYQDIWKESPHEFTLNIATTRGCPYKCNWCAKPIYGNRYNAHSPAYIAEEMGWLQEKYGVKRFWMCDDIFGLKPNWVQEFQHELDKRQLKISYFIQSRVDLLLKENTIDALAKSGLEEVWVGAESASQKILDAMEKGTKVEEIYEATRLLKAKNVKVAFFLQFGYLTENKKDIRKTIDMVGQLQPDNIGISISYPLPGTSFYEKVKDDLKLKANWTDSDDFEMLFNGTYGSAFYRKLQRFVHKEYRKSQGITNLKLLLRKPTVLNAARLKSVAKLAYYIPSAFLDSLSLKLHENEG